jgi:HEAT repeat protein
MTARRLRSIVIAAVLFALLPGLALATPEAGGPESRRMARAKDLIAEEQWARAIDELRAALADARESNKAEALFWLAHSQNQDTDFAAAVESIRRLEREYASSRWVKPARSLLIELAQKLKRDDVLWWTVAPVRVRPAERPPKPTPRRGVHPRVKPAETPRAAAPAEGQPTAVSATPLAVWVAEAWRPDADQRILALRSLIHTDAEKVIPMLRKIALAEDNPGAARRAVFVLAESRNPEALGTVIDVAKHGPDTVRVAAVRSLGTFGGSDVSQALLHVYSTSNVPVKRQVVMSLGERSEAPALMRIAQSEADRTLRTRAIVTLGRAGGRQQLLQLYDKADADSKRAIIIGLFTARAEEELIRIAEQERERPIRAELLSRLRLLGTPKARAYLAKASHPN